MTKDETKKHIRDLAHQLNNAVLKAAVEHRLSTEFMLGSDSSPVWHQFTRPVFTVES